MAPKRSTYTQAIDRMVNSGTIRPESRGWLISALDPFHDQTYEIEGLPDQYGGSTCVQLLKKQVQVSAPAGIAAGQTWDVMFWSAPTLDSRTAHPWTSNAQSFRQYPLVATGGLGTVNTTKCITTPGSTILPSGVSVGAWTPPSGWSTTCASPTDDGNSFSLMRLTGGGFEVHNTTPELYKGGAVSVFSQPQANELQSNVAVYPDYATTPASIVSSSVNKGRLPPATVGQVISNTTAKSWAAEYGVYVPFRLQAQNAGYGVVSSRPLVLSYAEDSASYADFYHSYGTEADAAVPGAGFCRADLPVRHQPMHCVGAYFTGLLPEATLTLDIRFFVEIAPTPSNQTLLSLARPSAPFDPIALELYTRALGLMLPGCMVGENADGSWWDSVSDVIKKISPMVATLGPYGQVAAMAADVGTRIGDSVSAANKARKANKKKPAAQPASKPNTAPPSDAKGQKQAGKNR